MKASLFKWKKADWETNEIVSMLCEDVEDLINRVSELEEKVHILTQHEKNINALWDQVELLQTKIKFEKENNNE